MNMKKIMSAQFRLLYIKQNNNADIFENVLNEMLLEWKGQTYVIKSTSIKYDGSIVTNEVVAKQYIYGVSKSLYSKGFRK
ncbi:Uncharacterised protein [Staphylococcus gallinarum]|uniref:Prophage endopeptidase tail N-terminal domain-containing protein n=1 Tax=Staphylococcus gallinarum TaxID=1293 RepID=A0A380FHW8_STAGA|nr:Uncharacterised protein [Staphylococcus gallinarum]